MTAKDRNRRIGRRQVCQAGTPPHRMPSHVAVSNHCGNAAQGLEYSYDTLQRPVSRNADSFGYNVRGEVVFSRRGAENAEETYSYDNIGNLVSNLLADITNVYVSNNRNQYTSINETFALSASPRETSYDLDGNMTRHGEWTYAYDSGNRLVSVASNGITVATMSYDTQGRRVKKVAADGTHRYFYDGWLLVYEHAVRPNNATNEIEYVWGKDVSGTRDGAAGIGGLLYQKRDGAIYVPWYDAYGNILGYRDAQGNVVAAYTYDAFGNIINQSGTMADTFSFRFSTKYFDADCGLYYYGYRYYKPQIMCWLTEDPIEEKGGENIYQFCKNRAVDYFDVYGATAVRINVGTELKDSPRGLLNFIKIDATVIEPPKKGGKLNFIQLKKSQNHEWELDIQGTLGPYYYKLFDVKKYSRKDKEGNEIVTLYDAPGGFLNKVDFFSAVVEVNRSCRADKHRYGFPIINCYDKVQVISSVSWSFNPNVSGYYQYSGKADNFIKRSSMIPTLQQLINQSTWVTELCPTTQVEVQNDRYGY